jgi:hypothetical protein
MELVRLAVQRLRAALAGPEVAVTTPFPSDTVAAETTMRIDDQLPKHDWARAKTSGAEESERKQSDTHAELPNVRHAGASEAPRRSLRTRTAYQPCQLCTFEGSTSNHCSLCGNELRPVRHDTPRDSPAPTERAVSTPAAATEMSTQVQEEPGMVPSAAPSMGTATPPLAPVPTGSENGRMLDDSRPVSPSVSHQPSHNRASWQTTDNHVARHSRPWFLG